MKKTNKGFTIVELVIVIAVIAILAAVLIPTFTGLIKKANLSNDQQMITNMNKALAIAFPGSKPATAGEAITALAGQGFYGDKLNTYSDGFHYVYSLENNKFYLIDDEGAVVYPDDSVELSSLWALYGDDYQDYIPGVTKYVATTALQDKGAFDKMFVDGSYVIDLNDNVMLIDAQNKSGITLSNGSVTVSGYATSGNESDAKVMKSYAEEQLTQVNGSFTYEFPEGVIENVIIPAYDGVKNLSLTGNTTLRNCVILYPLYCGSEESHNVTIENCTFVGIKDDKYAINIHGANGSVTISGNTFVDCGRGILVSPEEIPTKLVNMKITVENNVFNLRDDSKSNAAVRVASLRDTTQLIVKNNIMNGGNMLLRGNDTDLAKIIYSGNKLAEGIKEKSE